MGKAVKATELTLEMEDKVGLFADITAAMAEAEVNILSLCAYAMEGKSWCMMVTADNAKATSVAEAKGWKLVEREVVMVSLPNETGAAQKIADKIKAAGISLCYTYCTACSCDEGSCSTACMCRMVLCAEGVADKLLAVLND